MLVRKTYEFKLYAAARNRFLTRQIEAAAKAYNHCIKLHQRYWKLYHKHLGAKPVKKIPHKIKENRTFFLPSHDWKSSAPRYCGTN